MLARSRFGVAVVSLASTAAAGTIEIGPTDDVEGAFKALSPGDELVLAGGMYVLTERFSFSAIGTESDPIVIRAAAGEQPHFFRPDTDENIVDIDQAEHVVMRGIEFSGGSSGVRISAARFFTIEDCEIHDTADNGLRANDGGVYESLQILRNEIYDTDGLGEGMYLGCNNDDCRVVDSLIEGNYVHHTNQMSVEQGDGIELKEGSYNNIIRDNVVHDTSYPCILTYSTVGNGAANVIERNVLWNCGDHAIQSAADAIIRNNIILSANADGIAMQPHQAGIPSNLTVVHNTVLKASGDGITVSDPDGAVVIANNAIYAQAGNSIRISGTGANSFVTLAGNVGVGVPLADTEGNLANDFVAAHYDGAPPVDVFPAMGGALVGAGDPTYAVTDDFNCGDRPAGTPDVGAYTWSAGGNPGWVIQAGFKQCGPSTGGDDGGVGDGGGKPVDGGTDGDGDSGDAGDPDDSSGGGCGCQTVPGADPPLLQALAAVGAALAVRRRRRAWRLNATG